MVIRQPQYGQPSVTLSPGPLYRDVNKAGSFKAKAKSLKAKTKARDQG